MPVELHDCELGSHIKGGKQAKGVLNQGRGEYLDPNGMRMGIGEISTTRNCIVCSVHLMYAGWLSLGHVAKMEEGRRAFQILIGKPTGKRTLGIIKNLIA